MAPPITFAALFYGSGAMEFIFLMLLLSTAGGVVVANRACHGDDTVGGMVAVVLLDVALTFIVFGLPPMILLVAAIVVPFDAVLWWIARG